MLRHAPVLVHGGQDNWKARASWQDTQYFLTTCPSPAPTVHVSASPSPTAGRPGVFSGKARDDRRVTIGFDTFVSSIIAQQSGRSHYLHNTGLAFYLCQTRILSDVPVCPWKPGPAACRAPLAHLAADISVPHLIPQGTLIEANFWMSAGPSRSTLHYDANHNLLAVVRGCKRATLIAPRLTHRVSPCPVYGDAVNHSQATDFDSLFQALSSSAPSAAAVRGSAHHQQHERTAGEAHTLLCSDDPGIFRFDVRAGDMLFIPEGWWHQIDSDPGTVAVNFWFHGTRQSLFGHGMESYYSRLLLSELVEQTKEKMLAQDKGLAREVEICQSVLALIFASLPPTPTGEKVAQPERHTNLPSESDVLGGVRMGRTHRSQRMGDEVKPRIRKQETSDGEERQGNINKIPKVDCRQVLSAPKRRKVQVEKSGFIETCRPRIGAANGRAHALNKKQRQNSEPGGRNESDTTQQSPSNSESTSLRCDSSPDLSSETRVGSISDVGLDKLQEKEEHAGVDAVVSLIVYLQGCAQVEKRVDENVLSGLLALDDGESEGDADEGSEEEEGDEGDEKDEGDAEGIRETVFPEPAPTPEETDHATQTQGDEDEGDAEGMIVTKPAPTPVEETHHATQTQPQARQTFSASGLLASLFRLMTIDHMLQVLPSLATQHMHVWKRLLRTLDAHTVTALTVCWEQADEVDDRPVAMQQFYASVLGELGQDREQLMSRLFLCKEEFGKEAMHRLLRSHFGVQLGNVQS